MKKTLGLTLSIVMALAVALPAVAGGTEKVEMTGWITDQYCGAKNANADGADCAKACGEKGADMLLYSDGKLYKLSDKDMAMQHVGHKVVVTGTLGEGDVIDVASIAKAKA